MAVKKTLPKRYHTHKKNVISLAKEGLSKTVIIQKLQLSSNFFNIYTNPNPSDWFNQGKAEFAQTVMKSVRSTLEFNASTQRYLMDKLQLTRNEVQLPKMTDAKSAGKVLSEALQLYARKEISDTELAAIKGAAQIFSELHTSVDLERQIQELRTLMEDKFNG